MLGGRSEAVDGVRVGAEVQPQLVERFARVRAR